MIVIKQLMLPVDFHISFLTMEVNRDQVFCSSEFFKISSFEFNIRETYTGLEWHEGEKITIYIFGWTIPFKT